MADKLVKLIDINKLVPGTFLWRRVNDERCLCSHMRTEHEDTLEWGHGDCTVDECGCMEFKRSDG
jgi:hypothetical protein